MITPEQLAACGSESGHQKGLFAWLAWQPDPCLKLAFAVPNGGHRDKITAARMKAEGARAGVLDIFLPVARGDYHGLFIEMKVKGGRISDAQNKFALDVAAQGYAVRFCWSWEEARDSMISYSRGEIIG